MPTTLHELFDLLNDNAPTDLSIDISMNEQVDDENYLYNPTTIRFSQLKKIPIKITLCIISHKFYSFDEMPEVNIIGDFDWNDVKYIIESSPKSYDKQFSLQVWDSSKVNSCYNRDNL